jgi:early secretory antigenic target protein ESAT-6
MKAILTNYGSMAQMSSGLRTAASTTEQELQALTNSLMELRSTWEGDAQQQFDQIMVVWNKSIEEFNGCVNDTAVHVDRSSQAYADTDRHNQGYFQQA